MSRYKAVVILAIVCILIGCTAVSIRDSMGVCVSIPTDATVTGKKAKG